MSTFEIWILSNHGRCVDVFFSGIHIPNWRLMPWKDVEVLGCYYDIVPYYSPFTLDMLKIYVAKTCPKLSQTSGFFRCRGLIQLELKETKLRCGISRTRWWFQFMLYFSPRKLGEDFQFDYIILVFFRWLGSITNQRRLTWHLLEKKTHRLQRNAKEEVKR